MHTAILRLFPPFQPDLMREIGCLRRRIRSRLRFQFRKWLEREIVRDEAISVLNGGETGGEIHQVVYCTVQ